MPLWVQRLVTVAVGALLTVAGHKLGVPELIPVGTIVMGWALPHPADRHRGALPPGENRI